MVSENLLWDPEPGDNLIECEVSGHLTIGFDRGHCLFPFRELIHGHYNVMAPPSEVGLQSIKYTSHLVKGPTVIIMCNRERCEHMFHVNT